MSLDTDEGVRLRMEEINPARLNRPLGVETGCQPMTMMIYAPRSYSEITSTPTGRKPVGRRSGPGAFKKARWQSTGDPGGVPSSQFDRIREEMPPSICAESTPRYWRVYRCPCSEGQISPLEVVMQDTSGVRRDQTYLSKH